MTTQNASNAAKDSNSNAPELTAFSFDNKQVRTLSINGEPWFMANDVCRILEHSNSRKAIQKLDEDEKLMYLIVTSGQGRNVNFVNESGLYNLIFQSRKLEARRFRKWVTSEVLPSIRKNGCYIPLKVDLTGDFKGLMPIEINGRKLYCYMEVLRFLNYSAKSGSVGKRKKLYGAHFYKLFGRNFITVEYAAQLRQQRLLMERSRALQLELPFNWEETASQKSINEGGVLCAEK